MKEILAPMSTKEKIEYIWDYYKLHIIGTLFTFIAIGSFVHSWMSHKDSALQIMIAGEQINRENAYTLQETLNKQLLSKNERKEKEVIVQAVTYSSDGNNPDSAVSLQKIIAEIAAGTVDVLIIDKKFFDQMNKDGQLIPIQSLSEGKKLPYKEVYYSPANRKDIVGIKAGDIAMLKAIVYKEDLILCVPGNTNNKRYVVKFVDVMLAAE